MQRHEVASTNDVASTFMRRINVMYLLGCFVLALVFVFQRHRNCTMEAQYCNKLKPFETDFFICWRNNGTVFTLGIRTDRPEQTV